MEDDLDGHRLYSLTKPLQITLAFYKMKRYVCIFIE